MTFSPSKFGPSPMNYGPKFLYFTVLAAALATAPLLSVAAWSGGDGPGSTGTVIAPGANEGGGPAISTTNESARVTTYVTSPDTYAKIENPDPDDPESEPEAPMLGLMITIAPTLLVVGSTATGVIITGMGIDGTTAENYLRDNALALRHDLHRGAGSTLDDLAYLWGIERRDFPRFARLAHAHRQSLTDHLAHPLELARDDAYAFLLTLGQALSTDPQLSRAVLRL